MILDGIGMRGEDSNGTERNGTERNGRERREVVFRCDEGGRIGGGEELARLAPPNREPIKGGTK